MPAFSAFGVMCARTNLLAVAALTFLAEPIHQGADVFEAGG